jgi:hypothetical protein
MGKGTDRRGGRRPAFPLPYILAAACVAVAVWQLVKLAI